MKKTKKKYYAVKRGKEPGIYETWSQCYEQVNKFPGAQYKSFPTLEEAENYFSAENEADFDKNQGESLQSVDDLNDQIEVLINNLQQHQAIAFVDGSYRPESKSAGYGAIIFGPGVKDSLFKDFNEKYAPEFISLRNVAPEIEAVKDVLNYALDFNYSDIDIYYDYEGIEKWATGDWSAKNSITKEYVQFIKAIEPQINIKFHKVVAHSGIKYNEEVDQLAKQAILKKGSKTHRDGSVRFTKYFIKDWQSIVEDLNSEESRSNIRLQTEYFENSNRTKLTLYDSNSKVTINCYSNGTSFVQGKQSPLYQRVISKAIESIGSRKAGQTALEVLNFYHGINIQDHEIDARLEFLMPNYRKSSDKLHSTLSTAAYNTLLTGLMPDYTHLLMPALRAFEFYLHDILHGKLGLNTTNSAGRNNFSYFSKNDSQSFECNHHSARTLSSEQNEYLNELYSQYHRIRHMYSHWSAYEADVAVVTDMQTARNMIEYILGLFNRYYLVF